MHNVHIVKRLLTSPSLPIYLGLAILVIGGLTLLATAFWPNWASALRDTWTDLVAGEAVADRKDDAPILRPDPKITESAVSSSTTAVSASHVLYTRDRLVAEKKDFIEANLTDMNIKVYRGGEVALDLPIKGKGKVGSWWETPVGVYSVSLKKENHFSSFGHVYQPWSLVFQGNYFIHGWPYYPDGTPVSTSYSGGCIRMEDQYAKQVYDAAEVGMPVLVYKEPVEVEPLPDFAGDPLLEGDFVIADVTSGTHVRSRNADAETSFGPALNMLTALTAVDYVNVESNLSVGPAEGSARLAPISRVSVLDLLRLLLSEGDVEAARTIASFRGEETFVRYMNAKARSIGMANTKIVNVDASSPENRTTPADVALLARYLAENRVFVLDLSRNSRGNLAYDPPIWGDLKHSENLLALPGFVGGAAPAKGSGLPAVAVVTIETAGGKRQVAISIAGASDPEASLAAAAQWLQVP